MKLSSTIIGAIMAAAPNADEFDQRFEQLKSAAQGIPDEEMERHLAVTCCIETLLTADFTVDDVRFLMAIIGLAHTTHPGMFYERLRCAAHFTTTEAQARVKPQPGISGVTLRLDFSDLASGYAFSDALEHAGELVRQVKANPLGCRVEVVQNGNGQYFAEALHAMCGSVVQVIR